MTRQGFQLLFLLMLTGCENAPKITSQQKELNFSGTAANPTASTPSDAAVIYFSKDQGNTWVPYANGIPEKATVSGFVSMGEKTFVATESHGVFVENGRNNWQSISDFLPNGMDINTIENFDVAGLLLGTSKHGIFISHDAGKTWEQETGAINKTPIRCLFVYKNQWFAGTDNGIYRSIDKGKNWAHIYGSVQINGFIQQDGKIYAAAMNGAILSADEGNTWHYIYRPHTLHDISSDGKHIYALTLGEGLLRSSNDGDTWENVNEGMGTLNFYTFEVKNIGNDLFAAQWAGIYHRSIEEDEPWRLIAGGLPEATPFMTLAVVKNGIIAGTGMKK